MSYINVHIGVVVFYLFFVCDMFLAFSYTFPTLIAFFEAF